jgi:chromosome segregation ATPase
MIKKSILLLAMFAIATAAQAQKLYKIVDAEGNISFSQYPPTEKKENVTIDDITVSGGSKSGVSEKLKGLYCGEIRLASTAPSKRSTRNHVENLQSKEDSWRDQLDRLNVKIDANNQASINRNANSSGHYSSSSYRASQSKRYQAAFNQNSQQLRDLRCALDWVDSELDGTSEIVAENAKERVRLEEIRDNLQGRLDRRCGDLPSYDPSNARNSADRKSWYQCSDELRSEISNIDSALDKV